MSERFRAEVDELLADEPPGDAEALGSWLAPTAESRVEEIPIDLVREAPWRPLHESSDPAYRALKASVRASGILQPLLLRPRSDGTYEVVSGARRLRAARETAQSAIPAIVRELSDVEALVGGWDSMLRSGLSSAERDQLRQRLSDAGMGASEADTLLNTVPWRDTGRAPVAASPPPAPPAPAVEVLAPSAVPSPMPAPPEVETAAVAVEAIAPAQAEVAPMIETPAIDEADFSGAPMSEAPAVELAPAQRPSQLPVDPVVFPVGPLEPVWVAEEEEVTVGPASIAADATVEVIASEAVREAPPPAAAAVDSGIPPVQAPAQPPQVAEAVRNPAIVAFDLPGAKPPVPSIPTVDAPPVTAPPVTAPVTPTVTVPPRASAAAPSLPAATVPPELREPVTALSRRRPVAPRAPADPVPAFAQVRTRRRSSPLRAIIDPRTVATFGVASAVGAVVFLIVAVILGAGAGRPMTIAIVVALIGFVLAIISLALPRRDL